MEKNDTVAPILKWAGGKRQLLAALTPLLPERLPRIYCEPFLGGGAMLFRLRPGAARVNDGNRELVNVYEVVRDHVDELTADLAKHRNDPDHFRAVRSLDRDAGAFAKLSPVARASRTIYLNRTCYNGLYRVNRKGFFNTPFGRHKNPNIVNAGALMAMSRYLRTADVRFSAGDYEPVLEELSADAFVYLDPPYLPVSKTANFTGYTGGGFDEREQIRLKECCDRLDRRGIRFMLSNSATAFIRKLYAGYGLTIVKARRMVNSAADRRGAVDEVVIRNYPAYK